MSSNEVKGQPSQGHGHSGGPGEEKPPVEKGWAMTFFHLKVPLDSNVMEPLDVTHHEAILPLDFAL
jgi:hypothetical protein